MKITILQGQEIKIVDDMLLLMGLITTGHGKHCRLCMGNHRIVIAGERGRVLVDIKGVHLVSKAVQYPEYISDLLEIDVDRYLLPNYLSSLDDSVPGEEVYERIYQMVGPILDRLGREWYIDIVRGIKCLSSSDYIRLASDEYGTIE